MTLKTDDLYDSQTIASVKALDGKIYALLKEHELEVLWLFAAQGRKVGVQVMVDSEPLLTARIPNEHARLRSKNGVVKVTQTALPANTP